MPKLVTKLSIRTVSALIGIVFTLIFYNASHDEPFDFTDDLCFKLVMLALSALMGVNEYV